MTTRKDVTFIRVNGRIIPIRRKDAGIGAAEVAASAAVAAGSGHAAAKMLSKSHRFFRSSSRYRAFSKINTLPVHAAMRTVAAKHFVKGLRFAARSKWTILAGVAVSAALAGAASDRLAPKADAHKKALFSIAAPVIAVLAFNRRTALAHVALRSPLKDSIKNAFAAYAARGRTRTREAVNLFRKNKQLKLDL